jgi:hypothetical protein
MQAPPLARLRVRKLSQKEQVRGYARQRIIAAQAAQVGRPTQPGKAWARGDGIVIVASSRRRLFFKSWLSAQAA